MSGQLTDRLTGATRAGVVAAVASIRSRPATFVAGFVSIFLGAVVVGSFTSLLATGLHPDTSAIDEERLVTLASVVGGWGLLIVLFAVASTISVSVHQRTSEIGLMRVIGAVPRQMRRQLLAEASILGVVACLAAVLPACLVGSWVFGMIQDGGMVSHGLEHRAGLPFVLVTSGLILLVSLLAVRLASHGITGQPANLTLRSGVQRTARAPGMSWWRLLAAGMFLVIGAALSIVTATVMRDQDDPYAAMQTGGPASIFWSLGLAMLSPLLLRRAALVLGPVLALFGVSGHLAAHDTSRRSHLLAPTLAPVVVFVGMGLGTLYLMAIENQAPSVVGDGVTSADAGTLSLLNYLLVGMISTFAAIMVVNTVAAVVVDRRREFGQLRLAGATPTQVVATNCLEATLVVVTGLVAGGVASLGTILPYSSVKLGRVVPDVTPLWWVLVGSVAVLVTVGSTWVAVRRAMRQSALDAVGAVT
jgi:putative ABC transport system permease protein